PTEPPARDGMFTPWGRKPNDGPFPREVQKTTLNTRKGNPNLSSPASMIPAIKR
ncbi:hypothetical protein A2U01_0116314, partial [Trifolium medium]|nr:hypothetical protein [Trifolium medium]